VITALWAPDGSHRGFAKVTKDLTDRKRSEDALRGVLERERDAAERLRELDRMRSDVFELVAHDLRAPIGVIENLTHVLTTGWYSMGDEKKLEQLTRIKARTGAMSDLVEDLFDVVRIEAGQLEIERRNFDVEEVVRRALADAFVEAVESRVRTEFAGNTRAVGDPRRTWEVVVNLLTNAAKFSPDSQPIDVGIASIPGFVTVSVTDFGPGIPQEQQHLLFQRFSRLSAGPETPGSGLGLFIAKSLIEAQGGEISVRSARGEGATFRFRLPAAA
jgi:signal transduction histidine kinase